MPPQAREILNRIDDYMNYLKNNGGQESGEDKAFQDAVLTVRAMIEEMREHAAVDQLPPHAGLRFIKRPLMRLMKLVSRPQTSYNFDAINALETLLAAMQTSYQQSRANALDYHKQHWVVEEGLKNRVAELSHKIDQLADRDNSLSKRDDEQAEDILDVRRYADELHHKFDELKTSLNNLENWIRTNVDPRVDAQEKRLNSLAAQLETYDPVAVLGRLQSMADRFAGYERELTDFRNYCDQLSKEFSKGMGHEVGHNLENLRNDFDNLFRWVDGSLTPAADELKEKVRNLTIKTDQFEPSQYVNALVAQQQLMHEYGNKLRSIEQRVGPLADDVDRRLQQIGRELLIVLRDLESRFEEVLEKARTVDSEDERRELSEEAVAILDQVRYFYFELRARGGEDWLREKFQMYVQTIKSAIQSDAKGARRLAVDLGCGNGLFLTLMKESGFDTLGVDSNAAMLASARQRGIATEQTDALKFLAGCEPDSIDALSGMEFIEHLPKPALLTLIKEVNRCLKPGGVVLFETLNARTFAAYQWYFMDLTHQWLVLPETLQLLFEGQGLEIVHTETLSPVEEWKRLSPPDGGELDANSKRVNDALFGMQEYFCLARKPKS